ncbi:GNAT family N-acetyltransferase [Teredinibacter turnerae]|uniref:GNAT family N-acetyltransferase n=1 Tax=Teredinibacter turnerae TaxID=2426 RepID=UPI000407571A|nr:GNAT family N-acetyltransferase [Teredinibacter turnerae]
MVIVKAKENDAAIIAAIGQSVWVNTYSTDGVVEAIANYVASEFTAQNVLAVIRSRNVYLLGKEKSFIGYAVVNPGNPSELETLYILPRFQRKGYGTRLMRYIINFYKNLSLSCWEHNTEALRFYSKNGLAECGECYFELDGEKHRNIVLATER